MAQQTRRRRVIMRAALLVLAHLFLVATAVADEGERNHRAAGTSAAPDAVPSASDETAPDSPSESRHLQEPAGRDARSRTTPTPAGRGRHQHSPPSPNAQSLPSPSNAMNYYPSAWPYLENGPPGPQMSFWSQTHGTQPSAAQVLPSWAAGAAPIPARVRHAWFANPPDSRSRSTAGPLTDGGNVPMTPRRGQGRAAALGSPFESSSPQLAVVQTPLRSSLRRHRRTPFDWVYTMKDGTRQEQARDFLEQVATMVRNYDSRLRARLIVKSNSSLAIDAGGLSASLIEFASVELADRLGRAGQLLYSHAMDKAFVPRSQTITSNDELIDLRVLGALIGIIGNHRHCMRKRGVMVLPIPLPVVAFRALLRFPLDSVTDLEVNSTALAAIYRQYCGNLSPAECKRDKQVDVDDLFESVPGVDYSNADEYLRGLVRLLLNSPAFGAVSFGCHITRSDQWVRVPESYRYMYELVVGDPVASMEKLGRKLTIRANSASAHSNVYRVLSSMSDKGRADFLEATTGVRFLPLANDIHSRITVDVKACDAIVFHTCFRSVDIPYFVGQGITSSSHNYY
ncbi:unnamed protein product (mitochondrion) [Plasmodiophora brassicae]|uniref:Uncharacterized protein n=1 Tax=Plasmodiophora brassicae TaxID=37360 RepID=A0A3P3YD77_PLABS|nr:unnamed protein product [Plasmodiophora brassicae]